MAWIRRCIGVIVFLTLWFSNPVGVDGLYKSNMEQRMKRVASIHPKQTQTPRTLVIVLSETRAHALTFQRFAQNVLKPLHADLALCVADGTANADDPNNDFYNQAKYVWLWPDMKDWGDAYEYVSRVHYGYTDSRWRTILRIPDQFMGGVVDAHHQHPGSAGILFFMRWLLFQRLQPLLDQNLYDWYIVTRSDYYYLFPHPVPENEFDPDKIWIVEGEEYGGVTDRHVALPKQLVRYWLDFVHLLMEDTYGTDAWLRSLLPQHGGSLNMESILKERLVRDNIPYTTFARSMFSVRERDGTTRWATGEWDDVLRAYVKYPSERLQAESNFRKYKASSF